MNNTDWHFEPHHHRSGLKSARFVIEKRTRILAGDFRSYRGEIGPGENAFVIKFPSDRPNAKLPYTRKLMIVAARKYTDDALIFEIKKEHLNKRLTSAWAQRYIEKYFDDQEEFFKFATMGWSKTNRRPSLKFEFSVV
ncbi:MAG: hypothetical protein AAGE61_16890 [Pseudomonadota bacterium]